MIESRLSKEKSPSRSPFTMNDLGLENGTTWSGFLWYLTVPLGKDYVHNVIVSNPLKIVNNWFCSHLFFGLLKFQ